MRNLTEYNDKFILNLIKQAGGNPQRCTANVQYGVDYPRIVPFLVVYQDDSEDLDDVWKEIFFQKIEALEFCDEMHISKQDYDAMIDFYQNVEPSPDPVHDEELFIDELLADDYYAELQEAYDETIYSLKYSF